MRRVETTSSVNFTQRITSIMSTSGAPTNLSPSYQILYQKQQEHAGLQALRETSATLLERVEKLAEMGNIMADGGEGMSRGDKMKSVMLIHISYWGGTAQLATCLLHPESIRYV